MKPPKIIYLLCFVAWVGLIAALISAHSRAGHGRDLVTITVFAGLVLYFSYFAARRLRYDFVATAIPKQLVGQAEIAPSATLNLCRLESDRPLKIKVSLSCDRRRWDESFRLQILNANEKPISEDFFVPVFGRFLLETFSPEGALPITIALTNSTKAARKIGYVVTYAEVASKGDKPTRPPDKATAP